MADESNGTRSGGAPHATPRTRRSAAFARSDIYDGAEVFVRAVAEHSYPPWDEDDIAELADGLTDKAFEMLRDPEATWGARP